MNAQAIIHNNFVMKFVFKRKKRKSKTAIHKNKKQITLE